MREIINELRAEFEALEERCNALLRKNKSGCSCIINDDEVVSVLGASEYEPSEIEIFEAFDDWLNERPTENIRCYQPRMAWLEAWKRGMRFCPTKQKTSGKE